MLSTTTATGPAVTAAPVDLVGHLISPAAVDHAALFIPGVTCVVAADAPHRVWETARLDGIGGSDVAAACGINENKSPYTLWSEKTGRPVAPFSEKALERMRWGNLIEPVLRDEFQWKHPEYLVTPPPGTLAVAGTEWQRVNVDGLVWHPDGTLAAVLECKVGSHFQLKHWQDEDQVPVSHDAQVQWAMYITGAPVAWVVGLLDSHTYLERLIVRDEHLISDLLDLAGDFWSHVLADVAPELDGTESTRDTLARVAARDGSEIDLDPAVWVPKIAAHHELHEQIKAVEIRKANIGNEIRAAMGEHTIALVDGEKLASHKPIKARRVTDLDRLQAGWPEAYAACVTEGDPDPDVPPARRLDLSRSKAALAVLDNHHTTVTTTKDEQ